MIDEKLFDDAVKLASLWLANSKASSPKDYRQEVEGCVQGVYKGLVTLRNACVEEVGTSDLKGCI